LTARRGAQGRKQLWRIFGAPLLLALLSGLGLVSALVADDVWDALSWAALAIPAAVIVWFGWIRR
jgi:hypothetical protein